MVLIVAIFFACSDNSRNQNNSAFRLPPEGAVPRKLVVWTHEYPSFNQALEDKWIPEFEEEYGVEVEYEYIPFSGSIITYNTKVLSALAVGEGMNPDIDFGVATMPVVDPLDTESWKSIMYSFGWAVNPNKTESQQRLAQEFLAYILGKRGDGEKPAWWFANTGFLQPRVAFYESEVYRRKLIDTSWMKKFDDMYTQYSLDYYYHSSDEVGAALVRAIDRVVYNKMSPNESAELMQNELILLPDEN